MDVGVTDDSLNGVPVEGSSSSSESESEFDEEDVDGVVKSARRGVRRERPARLANMDDVKSRWEKREEAREERKQEIQQIRSRFVLLRNYLFFYLPSFYLYYLLPILPTYDV